MPDDYGRRSSGTEIQNLVAYLKTLRTRDFAKVSAAPMSGGLEFTRIRNSDLEPQNWLTYWGSYLGHHFSALDQINTNNVEQLRAVWAYQVPGGGPLETTPLVVDGVMYMTGTSGYVCAMDASSGRMIWQYKR